MFTLGGNEAAESKKEAAMENIPHTDTSHELVLAAVYAVNKAAKKQRDLRYDCLELLREEEVDGFPPAGVRDELERKGLNWSIELNGVAFAPFAYAPAFRREKQTNPEKWPDAHGMAIDELILMGREYDEDDDEYMAALAEQEKLAEEAINAAEETIGGLHEILHSAKERKKRLCQLKADAIAKLQVPFVGFHRGEGQHELYAFFNEDDYGFHMPVRFNYDEGYWEITSVEEVDEALWDLGDEMPELLNDDVVSMISAEVNEEKLLGLSEDEAVAILEEYLAG